MSAPTPATVALVVARDKGMCARCGRHVIAGVRGRDWSLHHRRPRGAGGSTLVWVNRPGNLILLCGDATSTGGCHAWVESNRDEARREGFLVPLNGIHISTMVPVMHAVHGNCILDDNGGITRQEVNF